MNDDTINRRAAIDEIARWIGYLDDDMIGRIQLGLKRLPSAQPERLTDDDFETIRIHLDTCKERLCNQGRWKEAKEYQRIYDRFMAFASAQPEIIRCEDCMHNGSFDTDCPIDWNGKEYCSFAERIDDE